MGKEALMDSDKGRRRISALAGEKPCFPFSGIAREKASGVCEVSKSLIKR